MPAGFCVFRVGCRVGYFNLCDVLQAHDVALGVGIYDLFCHIPLVVVGIGDVDGQESSVGILRL